MDCNPNRRSWSTCVLRVIARAVVLSMLGIPGPVALHAQGFTTDDPVIHRMWEVGMEHSQTEALAQVLMDSIGPRWEGTPNLASAQDWLLQVYASWGVPARKEQYGTFPGWDQGILHVDLIAPRVQSLEGKMAAFSSSTGGPVEGDVVALPTVAPLGVDTAQWLPLVEGKWVLTRPPEPTCRPDENLEKLARPETVERLKALREENRGYIFGKVDEVGGWEAFERMLGPAGALGIIDTWWSGGWGTFYAWDGSPDGPNASIYLSCEDYGLVYRLATNNQHPTLRIEAEAKRLGQVPQFNVIAELKGTELPDEYVVLSAHLDSWHSGTGATDNGTGTIMMLEAMRILKETYPNPRRTILVGHWGGEELVFAGSRTFREDHPEVVEGLQVLFNQDEGTARIDFITGQGLLHVGPHVGSWIEQVPRAISKGITLEFPGAQLIGGSDHLPFVCAGAPAFLLASAADSGYADNPGHTAMSSEYTHHTNRDTYDKIVFDNLKENATLAAMLAYAASEDPERVPRDRALLPIDPDTGEPREWFGAVPGSRAAKVVCDPRRGHDEKWLRF